MSFKDFLNENKSEVFLRNLKEWAKDHDLLLIRLSSGQYNSPKTEAAWKAFQAATKLAHRKSNW